ncbi:MAG: bifunctional (p)ppGpp synthetase/guanosine-3',5'-bis(diphosphate) 3'-pyrophosphohydrolase [Clostridia bacterium]|nr:bifunctional (p)ppGpp synthetase/guanosine-3',5'-bis(diphosphate) 3'-pyrophosphohydrolase [Clostridia bacterium]
MLSVLESIETKYKGEEQKLCYKAYDFAKKAHANQKRASGEEYFSHPCSVAQILVDLGLDAATISAAFLHDVLEDTPVSEGDIKKEFGEEILELVKGVTKLERIEFTSKEEEQAENFRKIFVAMAKDIRVIIIKLADRLHNMRSLNFLSKERQQRMARETLDVYAPLANRLGISQVKCELEDLCLKYLDPIFYEELSYKISERLLETDEPVNKVVREIKQLLEESKIKGEVFGRKKHLYSIYKKMKQQNKQLDQIYDVVAVRIIVKTVEECYEIFGKIHNIWKPIPGRIKDYIATPKPNMYKSLHTTVVTNFGKIFEIQIRTYEMNHAAEYGIAAHWKYKENKKEEDDFDQRLAWIREVMEWQGGLKDSKEFLNSLKGDVYSSEVLVFTPKGDVKRLPNGATPIDFAYYVHSQIGNSCVGAKVNSKVVPLNTTLQSGDVVEIITSKTSKGPSWDWLRVVKSSSARVKIKQFIKREIEDEHLEKGKQLFTEEANRRGYNVEDILTDEYFYRLASKMCFSSEEEMFSTIGYGAVSVNQVLVKLIDFYKKDQAIENNALNKPTATGRVVVQGMGEILVRFAGCCNPVPGDNIVAFISHGHGVTVHRADCSNVHSGDQKVLSASWPEKINNNFNACIRVIATDQTEILCEISSFALKEGLQILNTNGRIDLKTNQTIIDFVIKLKSKKALDALIEKIKSINKVIDVYRMAN